MIYKMSTIGSKKMNNYTYIDGREKSIEKDADKSGGDCNPKEDHIYK